MNPFRRPLIAGNWKMNAGGTDAFGLVTAIAEAVRPFDRVDVVVAPPFTALAAVAQELAESKSRVHLAAQNMHWESLGAFTGEVSASMLRDTGASLVLVGHSERRQLFGETDAIVQKKIVTAMREGLRPVACVGETLDERQSGATLAVVERQVRAFLESFAARPGHGIIAYEPVWAIGTGKVATPADAQEVHAMIRALLLGVSEELAEATKILYGGSVKADNARGLFEAADVDGALVGGASLDAAGFAKIVKAAQSIAEAEADDADPPKTA
jgi:triosephosphate isomerase